MYIDLTDINDWPKEATHCIDGRTFVRWEGGVEVQWNSANQEWDESHNPWKLEQYMSAPHFHVTERPKEEKSVLDVNPEDLVSKEHLDQLGVTYAALAKVYFTMGNSNGGSNIWSNLNKLFEEYGQKLYDELPHTLSDKELFNYCDYKDKWEAMLFPKASEKANKIKSIQEQIEALNKELDELKG